MTRTLLAAVTKRNLRLVSQPPPPRLLPAMVVAYAFCALLLGTAIGQEVKIRSHGAAPSAEKPLPAVAAAPASSPRELLELLGLADWLDRAADGADFPPQGDELLWRSLYTMRRLSLAEIDRWQRPEPVADLRASPEKFRGEIVGVTGTLVSFSRHEPPAEAAERFDLSEYYRCEIEVGPEHDRAIVYALRVPKQWQADAPVSQRVGVKGLFIMLGGKDALAPADSGEETKDEDPSPPVFVARRIAWYPQTPLGDLDMDVGLFDEISTRTDMKPDDRECFYQLLAAVGRAGTQQLLRAVPKEGRDAEVLPLFNRPQSQQGRLVELTGTARRAVRVRVEDRDIIERFGIDHFYELQVFTSDSQDNPLTFCVRELPPGFPEEERIIESVRIAGFFFKKWGFRSSAAAEPAKPGVVRKQLAPLLIGREPVWIRPVPADQRFANGVFLVLFVVLTVVLWLVVMRLTRSDAKFHRQVSQRFSPPPTEPLTAVGPFAEGGGEHPQTVNAANVEGGSEPASANDTDHTEDAATLLEIAAREISEEPFADQYRSWQQRRAFTGMALAVFVVAVIALRLLVWCLRQAGLKG